MKKINFILLILLFQLSGCSTQSELTRFEKATQIEQTLLMSELLVLGYLSALKKDMTLSTLIDMEIETCIKHKGEKVVSYAFATAINETLSESEINEGFLKANSLALNKANEYIIRNIDFLSSEYHASNTEYKAPDFFLLKASKQQGFSKSERQAIGEFVSWHQNAGVSGFGRNWKLQHALIKSDLLEVLQNCTSQ